MCDRLLVQAAIVALALAFSSLLHVQLGPIAVVPMLLNASSVESHIPASNAIPDELPRYTGIDDAVVTTAELGYII